LSRNRFALLMPVQLEGTPHMDASRLRANANPRPSSRDLVCVRIPRGHQAPSTSRPWSCQPTRRQAT
jgi:hypothetical protein